MKIVYLNSGWSEGIEFAEKVEKIISEMNNEGWHYKDIKISSKNPDTLVIFEKL